MKSKCTIILFVILGFTFSFAQQLNIKVNNSVGEKAAFYSLSGEKISFIDTISLSDENRFEFNFNESKQHSGFYRLSLSSNKWIDFIFDNEVVIIETYSNNIPALPAGRLDSLKVIESGSNQIYYAFVKRNKDYKTKTELLQLILARYPKKDDYYQTTKEKLIQVQEEYLYFVNATSQKNPNSFVARYVRSAQLPVIDTSLPLDEQLQYLKSHALNNVNFYDDGLIYSDVFTNKTIEYLTYYRNPQLPKELLEKEFMIAIDTILTKAKVNLIVYQHIVEYLIDGFRKFGLDQSIDYIVENYVIKDDLCLDAKLENSIDRRIVQARNFKIGSTVPNIIINDSSGNQIELNKINSEQVLIVFYASWCPYCQTLVPKIYELYKNQKEKKFEVLAISIDTSQVDWLEYIRDNNLNWINVSDLKGWDGEATLEYFIYATPTMILLDKDKKIIAKPSNIDELKKSFL